jgi:hypothetical protein
MPSRPALTLTILVLAIVGIVVYRYDQYVLNRQYLVDAAAPCDPALNSCFVADCSPDEDPSCDTTPYEKVELPGALAPGCLLENSCEAFTCTADNDCVITYCAAEDTEDGEICTTEPEDNATQ